MRVPIALHPCPCLLLKFSLSDSCVLVSLWQVFCLCLFLIFATPLCVRDLSFRTRDRIHAPVVEVQSPALWTCGEFLVAVFVYLGWVGLRCGARTFLWLRWAGLLFVAMQGLLTMVASLVEAQALGAPAWGVVAHGLAAPWHVWSSQIRDWTCVPRVGGRILTCCTTRAVHSLQFWFAFFSGLNNVEIFSYNFFFNIHTMWNHSAL